MLAHRNRQEVLALADYIGSTSGIIEFATKSESEAFIVCTEMGVMYELKQKIEQTVLRLSRIRSVGYEADYAGKKSSSA